jgi:hypothetical protein
VSDSLPSWQVHALGAHHPPLWQRPIGTEEFPKDQGLAPALTNEDDESPWWPAELDV